MGGLAYKALRPPGGGELSAVRFSAKRACAICQVALRSGVVYGLYLEHKE